MRLDFDTYKEIADSLLRNRSRSLLTGFGIFWGLFMLLFMVGGGSGLKQMLSRNFEGFATNTTIIFSSETSKPYKGFQQGRNWNLDTKDIVILRNMVPELDIVTPISSWWGQNAVRGINSVNCNAKGVFHEYCKIEEPLLRYGRYVSDSDCRQERKVCVIGKKIYNSLFPDGGDPCGQWIQVAGIYFQIIGVDYSAGNMNIQGRADEAVIVPLPVLMKLRHMGNAVQLIAMTGRNGIKMTGLEPRIRQVVAHTHSFNPEDKSALVMIHTEQLFRLMDNLFNGLDFLIWLVGLGTILAGAIGVSNIMMVTVKERTTEIGIRRAIGATPKQILSQILSESVTLTLAAGSAGIVFSVLLLNLMEKASGMKPDSIPVDFQINFWTATGAVAALAALGAVAGLAPALRAMAIKPVDAMRDE